MRTGVAGLESRQTVLDLNLLQGAETPFRGLKTKKLGRDGSVQAGKVTIDLTVRNWILLFLS